MEDQLILIDLFDREIGYGPKLEVHRRGQLHRAFSVFLIDGDRMLIQQRNPEKYHSGGLWANACCSHPRKGENLEEAVVRRMEEELGIRTDCKELFHFVYYSKYSDEMHEYELDHVFLGTYHGDPSFSREEIAQVKWVSMEWLAEDLKNHPEQYTSWFQIAAPSVLEKVWSDGRNR